MPLLGNLAGINLADNSSYAVNRSLALEAATVGLFETVLENGVGIEITAGNHTGFMRYTFPSMGNYTSATMDYGMSGGEVTDDINEDDGSDNVHVLVDLTHVLPAYSAMPYSQKFLRGDLHIRSSPSSSNQTIQPSYYGSATYTGGWSQPDEHTLFFCGNFSLPATSPLHPTSAHVQQKTANAVDGAGTFSWPYNPFQAPAFAARPSPRSFTDVKSYAGSGMGIGALFSWAHSRDAGSGNGSANVQVEAKVGISYISAERACSHVEAELPASMSFEDVVGSVRREWEDRVLSKVVVVDDGHATSANATLKRMLYSALYQTGLMPTDKTGENPRWESGEGRPYYDDHYVSPFLKFFRSIHPQSFYPS